MDKKIMPLDIGI